MKTNYSTKRVSVPTAFVTKGRQRVKQYDNNIVYLKNGDEFEIELFNPTSNKVLAKINLNGKSLGSGLILRPGERVFLERYFDEAKKFLFETYEVNANDPNVQEAIKMNGIINVEFYDEYREPYVVEWPIVYHYHHYHPWYQYHYYPWYQQPYYPSHYWSSSGNTGGTGQSSTYSCSNNQNSFFTCSVENSEKLKSDFQSDSWATPLQSEVKETGRVEKGSYSNQSFIYDSTTFKSYCSWTYTWKILPESQRSLVKEDLKVFCQNCGTKRKKANHKFCPNCGSKLI
jgi:hypothetical protein